MSHLFDNKSTKNIRFSKLNLNIIKINIKYSMNAYYIFKSSRILYIYLISYINLDIKFNKK